MASGRGANLPPLLGEQRGITVPVPHPARTHVPVSSVLEVVQEVLKESHRKTQRHVGAGAGGKIKVGRIGHNHPVLPKENRVDPAEPLPVVTEDELNKGLYSCIRRGLIPTNFDVTMAMGGEAGEAPMASAPVHLRPHAEQFARRDLLTADYGLAPICNLKLDVNQVLNARAPSPPPPPAEAAPPAAAEPPVEEMHHDDVKDHLGDKERDDARTYTELLDLYSLHEFVIRKGKALDSTPEFQSFQRSHLESWGAIKTVVQLLEQLLTEHQVPLAYINGKAVARLAHIDLGQPTVEQLLGCIANRGDVDPLLAMPGRRYQEGDDGLHKAARKIQSVVRMFLTRRMYRNLRASSKAAKLIQRQWHIYLHHMVTRNRILMRLKSEEKAWRKTMDRFIRDWGKIKHEKRVVIHLPSLSYTPEQCHSIPFYDCCQNAQLARVLDLADSNVELVYISPFQIEPEALQYYMRLLQLAGVNDAYSRLQVIVPENHNRLPPGLSLSKAVLFSQKNLRRLASIIKGKTAYMVPGVVGKEDLHLAGKLDIPMISPDPTVAAHFASKSGAKRIFELADVVTPIGAYDMFEEGELLVILSKFMAEYPEYPRWLIKIDNEFNGRGLACVDVRRLRCLEDEASRPDVATLREKIYLELKDYIGKRVKIITPHVYPEWGAFIRAFNKHGGVVEACPHDVISSPVANLYIHPDGAVQLLSVQEQLLSPQYCTMGASFPQTTVPHQAIRDASLSIGCVCYQKNITGYASVEFVAFKRGNQKRMWAVDLELSLTNNSLAHRLFQFTTASKMDPETGLFHTPSGEAYHYVYSGLIYHPYIGALRHSVFFNRCKLKGLAFDLVERTGTVFHLVDSILRGCLGLLCIDKTEDDAIRMLSEGMDFVQQQLTNSTADESDSNFSFAAAAARTLFQKVVNLRRVQGQRKRLASK
eukprot:TRINITY_DN20824_c0_g1_i1.p1 TRINITY_DN20824_c0_g1~~TRINITY_DN20824_c0_g1_i1.p1  ORF type:complete len:929 (+),score=385.08 TRINITY_DN20824_c0_g1_i1:177-2963(+)